MGGWMIIPGWRRRGFNPLPSWGIKRVVPAGWNIAVEMLPVGVCQKLTNGFSTKMLRRRKNAKVTRETRITQGRNSRSRSHLRRVTAEAKADINQDQKINEPACPPQSAVIRRYMGILLLETS